MEIEINNQFKKALDIIENTNSNLFLTGKAGTGKSTLLTYFMKNTKKNFAILAPTGVAALNVGGVTIHSFFGFKPSIDEEKCKKIAFKKKGNKLYTKLKTIVIDEVSMVRADLMDFIDIFLRIVRKTELPFGGVQMILIGDLFQLPPVLTSRDKEYFLSIYKSPYFFDSKVFNNADFDLEFVELEKIYRQNDQGFIDLLNSIRTKTVTRSQMDYLNDRVNYSDLIDDEFIYLTSTNALAAKINENRLDALDSEEVLFEAKTKGNLGDRNMPTERNLYLKEGAQVMFVNNDAGGRWVNGTIGHVIEILNDELWVLLSNGEEVMVERHKWEINQYYFDNEKQKLAQETIGSFKQIPLKLAWAITIHKSQGKTFEKVVVDLGWGSFASGQTYVALSRCTTFEGIVLKNRIKMTDIKLDFRVQQFIKDFQHERSAKNLAFNKDMEKVGRYF